MRKNCFIVTSCICPCDKPFSYIDTRSIYTPEERLLQTQGTIDSIRKYCPDSDILLIDNGLKDTACGKIGGVDKYIYIGDNWLVRKAADSSYKSLGELMILLEAGRYLSGLNDDYEMIFKLSGRYQLSSNFKYDNFPHDAFTFYHLANRTADILGYHSYVPGVHSTRLFAVPGKAVKEYYRALWRTFPWFLKGESLEAVYAKHIHYPLYYVEKIGVTGNVGVDKSWKNE